MPKFINLDINHLTQHRVVHYEAGDVLSIAYHKSLKGFGLRFGPIQNFEAWNLRSFNSSVGLDTYAPSQHFELDGVALELKSAGDESLELTPYRSGNMLIIRAAHAGSLQARSSNVKAYQPPDWAYDFWFTTPWPRMSEENVLSDIASAHQHHLAPKVWLLDAGWASHTSYLEFNNDLFPSGNRFLQDMRSMDLRPILWVSPYIDAKTENWRTFDHNGWLVKDARGKSMIFPVTGDNKDLGSYIDYTSASFLEYFKTKIANVAKQGLGGVMFDFGEAFPDDAVLQCTTPSSQTAREQDIVGHNWYVGEIKRVLHEIAEPLGLCIISRSGWTDSYAHTGLWLGDQSSDASRFAGLESVTWGYKTAHDAGYRFIGMDTGGYFGFPTLKDYKRWLDLSVTMPFTMLHGALQSAPWEEGSEALTHYRKCHELHQEIWKKPHEVALRFSTAPKEVKITTIKANDYTFVNDVST
jgi:hypothetical protein